MTTEEEAVKEVVFGGKALDPDEEASYREKILKAKAGGIGALKGNDPVGMIPRPKMPMLQRESQAQESTSRDINGGVQPRPPGSPVLTQQTQKQLEAFNKAQAADTLQEDVKKEVEEKKDDLFEMFDMAGLGEADRVLNNRKRREEIEKRLVPMDIHDLFVKDEVRQNIPVIPGKFEVVLRSVSPEENLFIKQIMAKDSNGSDSYVVEKLGICQLACALVSVNGVEFIDHRKNNEPDEELFKKKIKQVMRKPGVLINDLSLQYVWFDIRVRKLLVQENLGNG